MRGCYYFRHSLELVIDGASPSGVAISSSDNVAAHKPSGVGALIEQAGATIRFLPPLLARLQSHRSRLVERACYPRAPYGSGSTGFANDLSSGRCCLHRVQQHAAGIVSVLSNALEAPVRIHQRASKYHAERQPVQLLRHRVVAAQCPWSRSLEKTRTSVGLSGALCSG
jgi:hypothetical protein